MKVETIYQIILDNVSIATDSECGPTLVGMDTAAEKIKELLDAFKVGDELIKLSNQNEPKY